MNVGEPFFPGNKMEMNYFYKKQNYRANNHDKNWNTIRYTFHPFERFSFLQVRINFQKDFGNNIYLKKYKCSDYSCNKRHLFIHRCQGPERNFDLNDIFRRRKF